MTIRTQSHHPSTGAVIPSAGLEANFVELYDLQDGGIDGTNMDLTATFAWTGVHSFAANVTFDTNLLYVDATNNRIYEGATASTSIDSINYQHQIKVLNASTPAFALISTATGSTGVREARYHNSATPANNDLVYGLRIYGNNDAAEIKEYARITVSAEDVSAGTEDSQLYIDVMKAGTLTTTLMVDRDQVQARCESFVVGTNTNVVPYGSGQILGLYVKNTSADRRVAMFESTDATASAIIYDFYKNSASPAASDVLTQLRFVGNDSAGNETFYAEIISRITDATNGSEDGQLDFVVISNSSATTFLSAVSTAGAITTTLTGTLAVVGNTNTITSTNTTGDALTITASSLTTGSALVVYSNSSSTSTRNLVEITNDHASADNATCLYITQDGDEPSIYIDHNGIGNAIEVNFVVNSASDVYGISLGGSNAGAGNAVCINISGSPDFIFEDFSGVFQNVASAGATWGKFPVKTTGGTKYVRLYDS